MSSDKDDTCLSVLKALHRLINLSNSNKHLTCSLISQS